MFFFWLGSILPSSFHSRTFLQRPRRPHPSPATLLPQEFQPHSVAILDNEVQGYCSPTQDREPSSHRRLPPPPCRLPANNKQPVLEHRTHRISWRLCHMHPHPRPSTRTRTTRHMTANCLTMLASQPWWVSSPLSCNSCPRPSGWPCPLGLRRWWFAGRHNFPRNHPVPPLCPSSPCALYINRSLSCSVPRLMSTFRFQAHR